MKTRSLLLAATCISVASALSAQQPVNLPPAETAVTAAPVAPAPAAPAPEAPAGPRVRAELQPVTFSSATAEPMARRRATTVTLSTLALVLVVVLVVLLVT